MVGIDPPASRLIVCSRSVSYALNSCKHAVGDIISANQRQSPLIVNHKLCQRHPWSLVISESDLPSSEDTMD